MANVIHAVQRAQAKKGRGGGGRAAGARVADVGWRNPEEPRVNLLELERYFEGLRYYEELVGSRAGSPAAGGGGGGGGLGLGSQLSGGSTYQLVDDLGPGGEDLEPGGMGGQEETKARGRAGAAPPLPRRDSFGTRDSLSVAAGAAAVGGLVAGVGGLGAILEDHRGAGPGGPGGQQGPEDPCPSGATTPGAMDARPPSPAAAAASAAAARLPGFGALLRARRWAGRVRPSQDDGASPFGASPAAAATAALRRRPLSPLLGGGATAVAPDGPFFGTTPRAQDGERAAAAAAAAGSNRRRSFSQRRQHPARQFSSSGAFGLGRKLSVRRRSWQRGGGGGGGGAGFPGDGEQPGGGGGGAGSGGGGVPRRRLQRVPPRGAKRRSSTDRVLDILEAQRLRREQVSPRLSDDIKNPLIIARLKAVAAKARTEVKKRKAHQMPRFLIDPRCSNKLIWDVCIGVLILYSVFETPWRLAFMNGANPGVAEYLIDGLFGVDILVSFTTSHYVDNILQLSRLGAALHYLQTWFLVDFLSVFPLDLILYLIFNGAVSTSGTLSLLKTIRLFRLIKVLRVARLQHKSKTLRLDERLPAGVGVACRVALVVALAAHLTACFWFLSNACARGEADDWTTCGDPTHYSQYLAALYWTMQTLLSVGYGDISVTVDHNGELLFVIAVQVLGASVFGFIISSVGEVISKLRPNDLKRKEVLESVRMFTQHRNLPKALGEALRDHFDYRHRRPAAAAADDPPLLDPLPPLLRGRLLKAATRTLMTKFPTIFSKQTNQVMTQLAVSMNPFVLKAGEELLNHTFLDQVYFIERGLLHGLVKETALKTGNSSPRAPLLGTVEEDMSTFSVNTDFEEKSGVQKAEVIFAVFKEGGTVGLYEVLQTDRTDYAVRARVTSNCYFMDAPVLTEILLASVRCTQNLQDLAEKWHRACLLAIRQPNRVYFGVLTKERVAVNEELLDPQFLEVYITGIDGATTYNDSPLPTPKVSPMQRRSATVLDPQSVRFAREQLARPRRWVHPASPAKVRWDVFMAAAILLSVFLVPYQLGMALESTSRLLVLNFVIDGVFAIDMGLNFITAYKDENKVLVNEKKKMATHYLRSWFLPDFVSTVPFDFIVLQIYSSGTDSAGLRGLKLIRMIRLIRLVKLLRLAKLSKILEKLALYGVQGLSTVTKLSKPLTMLLVFSHLFGCFWVMTITGGNYAETLDPVENNTWLAKDDVEYVHANDAYTYASGLYWAFTTMTTVGYGDLSAMNDTERLYSIIIMFLGSILFSVTVGTVTSVLLQKNMYGALAKSVKMSTNMFLDQINVSGALRQEIQKHKSFVTDASFSESELGLLNKVPQRLRFEIITYVLKEHFDQIPIMRKHMHNQVFIISLAEYLLPQFAVAGSPIYKANTPEVSIHFLCTGEAALLYAFVQEKLYFDTATKASDLEGSSLQKSKMTRSEFKYNKKLTEKKERTKKDPTMPTKKQWSFEELSKVTQKARLLSRKAGIDFEGIVPGSTMTPGMCFGYEHVLDMEFKLGAVALTNCTMFTLARKAMEECLVSRPQVGERILRSLQKLIRHQLLKAIDPTLPRNISNVSLASTVDDSSIDGSPAGGLCKQPPPASPLKPQVTYTFSRHLSTFDQGDKSLGGTTGSPTKIFIQPSPSEQKGGFFDESPSAGQPPPNKKLFSQETIEMYNESQRQVKTDTEAKVELQGSLGGVFPGRPEVKWGEEATRAFETAALASALKEAPVNTEDQKSNEEIQEPNEVVRVPEQVSPAAAICSQEPETTPERRRSSLRRSYGNIWKQDEDAAGALQRVKLALDIADTRPMQLHQQRSKVLEASVLASSGTLREFSLRWVEAYEDRLLHLMNFQRVLRAETFDIQDQELASKVGAKKSAIGFIKMLQGQVKRNHDKGKAAFLIAAAKLLKNKEQKSQHLLSSRLRESSMVNPHSTRHQQAVSFLPVLAASKLKLHATAAMKKPMKIRLPLLMAPPTGDHSNAMGDPNESAPRDRSHSSPAVSWGKSFRRTSLLLGTSGPRRHTEASLLGGAGEGVAPGNSSSKGSLAGKSKAVLFGTTLAGMGGLRKGRKASRRKSKSAPDLMAVASRVVEAVAAGGNEQEREEQQPQQLYLNAL